MPIDPASIEASSERMSPNRLPVTITSNCFGAAHELHRGIVDVHVRQRDVRIVGGELRHHFAPEDRRCRARSPCRPSTACASACAPSRSRRARCARSPARCSASCRSPRRRRRALVRRPRGCAEVDVAGQLAHDHDVEAGDHLGLQRRGRGELRIEHRGAQVGEQRERLADAEDALLRPQLPRQRVVARSADGAQQHGVGGIGRAPASPRAAGASRRRSRRRRSARARSRRAGPRAAARPAP